MRQALCQALGTQRSSRSDGVSALREFTSGGANGYLPNGHKITLVTRAWKLMAGCGRRFDVVREVRRASLRK